MGGVIIGIFAPQGGSSVKKGLAEKKGGSDYKSEQRAKKQKIKRSSRIKTVSEREIFEMILKKGEGGKSDRTNQYKILCTPTNTIVGGRLLQKVILDLTMKEKLKKQSRRQEWSGK